MRRTIEGEGILTEENLAPYRVSIRNFNGKNPFCKDGKQLCVKLKSRRLKRMVVIIFSTKNTLQEELRNTIQSGDQMKGVVTYRAA